jgi:repressor LexA
MNDRARQILNFIERFTDEKGYPPTIREIGEEFGIASTNGVRYYVTMLQKLGRLTLAKNSARGIRSTSIRKALAPAPGGIPVLGRVAAGQPILAEQECESTLPLGDVFGDPARLFALRVRGDSMVNAGILDGDYVIVRQSETASAGEIVVALLENDATVKYYQPRSGRIELVAANPAYAPIQVGEDSGFSIAGVVTGVLRTLGR